MKPNFSVLFCDDIRHEVGGKISLMGIYGTHLLLPALPSNLSKLSVHFSIEIPNESTPEAITITIFVGGKQHAKLELGGLSVNEDPANEINGHRLLGGTSLSNIEFNEKTRIEAVIELDNKKVYSAYLVVDAKENYQTDYQDIDVN